MAVDTIYAVGLRDVQVYPITDLSTPTYGSGVDMPAAATMEVSGTFSEVIAEGDDVIVTQHALPNGAEWTLEASTGLSLPVLEVLLGGTASDSGSTPNEVSYWDFTGDNEVPWFGFIGKAIDSETGGDTHCQVFKAKVTSGPGGAFAYNSFKPINWSGRALGGPYTGSPIFRVLNHETATDIPASWPDADPYTSS